MAPAKPVAVGARAPEPCCDTVLLSTCCPPEEKTACCGQAPPAASCGCQSGGSAKRNMMTVATDNAALPWEQLRGNLRRFIGRRVQNAADADDLVQRVLLQIVNGIGSLRDEERIHAWVYRMARNAIVDHYRSSAAKREVASGDALDLAATEHAPEELQTDDERIALRELAACMTPMVAQLPDAYRDALTLTDLEGLNQADAARRVGVSLSGMKSRVQRGRRQLRTVLEECCRVERDRRGAIVDYTSRKPGGCGCNDCE